MVKTKGARHHKSGDRLMPSTVMELNTIYFHIGRGGDFQDVILANFLRPRYPAQTINVPGDEMTGAGPNL